MKVKTTRISIIALIAFAIIAASTLAPGRSSAAGPAIAKTKWQLVYADSEELVGEDGAAVNAFDGDPATMWHTQWKGDPDPAHPHEIVIDLGATYDLDGFSYQPFQVNGRIIGYEFYVSALNGPWSTPVASGALANDASIKTVSFATATGRYIRLVALSEPNGNPWTSAAEIGVTGALSGSSSDDQTTSSRVSDGLIVYYPFTEGAGSTLGDQSNNGAALNMEISGAVSWLSDSTGVEFAGGRIGTSAPADKIINALSASGASTFEVWALPANLTQSGPVRLISVGADTSNQNFMLGQTGSNYQVRLLHTAKDAKAMPRLETSGGVATAVQHIVHTYDGTTERLYINGVQRQETVALSGNFSNWDTTDLFSIGNEASSDRSFYGRVYLVAVYDRALSAAEVQQNFDAGKEASTGTDDPGTGGSDLVIKDITIADARIYHSDANIIFDNVVMTATAQVVAEAMDSLYLKPGTRIAMGARFAVRTDSDGLPNAWEFSQCKTLKYKPGDDPDLDGLTMLEEYQYGTKACNSDSDDDGMPDGWEVKNGLDPLFDDANGDLDGDGYTNGEEYPMGTSANDANSKPPRYDRQYDANGNLIQVLEH